MPGGQGFHDSNGLQGRGTGRATPAAAPEEPSPPGIRTFAVSELPRAMRLAAEGYGGVSVGQLLGCGLVRSVGLSGVRIEIWIPEGLGEAPWGLLFDSGTAKDLEPLRRTAEMASGRVRVSACWQGKDEPWLGLLRSVASVIDAASRNRQHELGTTSPATLDRRMLDLESQLERMAAGDLAILISGESGTGKEVASRRVHAAAGGPFVDLNCAALPRDLLESELFGVEKGVATGVDARPGKFELAHGGTLFLDEIGDMAPDTQAKVLRVLQEGEVFRLGGERPRPARPRVVAATNLDLRSRLGERFRADLFHRLAGFEARLSPLRERTADVVNLAVCFLDRALARQGFDAAGITMAAAEALRHHAWPGNVRQLEREMERAALFLDIGEILDVRHLTIAPGEEDIDLPLAEVMARAERRMLLEALEENGGDAPRAAAQLGVARSTFYRRLKELGIEAQP